MRCVNRIACWCYASNSSSSIEVGHRYEFTHYCLLYDWHSVTFIAQLSPLPQVLFTGLLISLVVRRRACLFIVLRVCCPSRLPLPQPPSSLPAPSTRPAPSRATPPVTSALCSVMCDLPMTRSAAMVVSGHPYRPGVRWTRQQIAPQSLHEVRLPVCGHVRFHSKTVENILILVYGIWHILRAKY